VRRDGKPRSCPRKSGPAICPHRGFPERDTAHQARQMIRLSSTAPSDRISTRKPPCCATGPAGAREGSFAPVFSEMSRKPDFILARASHTTPHIAVQSGVRGTTFNLRHLNYTPIRPLVYGCRRIVSPPWRRGPAEAPWIGCSGRHSKLDSKRESPSHDCPRFNHDAWRWHRTGGRDPFHFASGRARDSDRSRASIRRSLYGRGHRRGAGLDRGRALDRARPDPRGPDPPPAGRGRGG